MYKLKYKYKYICIIDIYSYILYYIQSTPPIGDTWSGGLFIPISRLPQMHNVRKFDTEKCIRKYY